LDRHGSHDSAASRRPAGLWIELLFLPRQCPDLNPMDHLRRGAKAAVSANRQYADIGGQADEAGRRVLTPPPREAKRQSGLVVKEPLASDLAAGYPAV
jgi:hypothetical protein